HASTQMAVHNLDGVKQLEKLGFNRVVLSREVGLEEIKHIHKNSNIEIEFFVQGALCVSFSGNCYLCSYLANKSGNRGVCQQFCRLPFEAYENNKLIKKGNLLSAKDICLIEKLQDLKEAGVVSLKIEGRARRPFYVGQVCKTYSKVLENNFKYNQNDINNLKLAFNREFTPAYFNGNANIISKFHNHVGVKIGHIEQVKFGKNFNEVFCISDYQLAPKSAIKIFANDKEIATLAPHDVKWTKNGFKFTTT
ncbi:MAG: U32 family peptidase, partial [Clostridia bacterium]|nr:U32 family peptidase [Clostridia bacterium]